MGCCTQALYAECLQIASQEVVDTAFNQVRWNMSEVLLYTTLAHYIINEEALQAAWVRALDQCRYVNHVVCMCACMGDGSRLNRCTPLQAPETF